MRECWINVYINKNGIWYGSPRESSYQAMVIGAGSKYLIYRIHVRMIKDSLFQKVTPITRDSSDGMSLRDWFAGQAIAGGRTSVPSEAYRIADAMLKEREKQ